MNKAVCVILRTLHTMSGHCEMKLTVYLFLKALSDLNAKAEKNPKEKTVVLQSYDISPYQGSDDEDEDDEYETNKQNEKFVPSWARFLLSFHLFIPMFFLFTDLR